MRSIVDAQPLFRQPHRLFDYLNPKARALNLVPHNQTITHVLRLSHKVVRRNEDVQSAKPHVRGKIGQTHKFRGNRIPSIVLIQYSQ